MSNLHEKAVLVKLTSHKPTLMRRADDKTAQLQQLTDDKAAAAYVKLFKFRTPVQEVLSRHREVIRLHQRLTLPYEDRGPRLLPNARYLDYTTQMRTAMDSVAEWFDQHRALPPFGEGLAVLGEPLAHVHGRAGGSHEQEPARLSDGLVIERGEGYYAEVIPQVRG